LAINYSYNNVMIHTAPHCPAGANMAMIEDPAGTVLQMDYSGEYRFGPSSDTSAAINLSAPGVSGVAPARHNGGINAIYCDGHAKWQTVNAMLEKKMGADGVYRVYQWTIDLEP